MAGSAPMKQNRPAQPTVRRSPVAVCSSVTCSRWLSPVERAHLGVREELDARVGLDALDQVARHARGEVVAPDRDRDLAALLREVDRGLAGGVPAADDDDVGAGADARLEVGRGVVHARALEPLEVVDRETLVARARRDDHARDGISLPSPSTTTWKPLFDAQARDLARRVEARAEPLGLDRRARPRGPRRRSPFGNPT